MNQYVAYAEKCCEVYSVRATWRPWRTSQSSPRAYHEQRHVFTPYPTTPGLLAIFLHEAGHVAMGEFDNLVRNEHWACLWAHARYEESGLPGIENAEFTWRRNFGSYLRAAIQDGLITRSEIVSTIPDWLVAADRLGIRREPVYDFADDCLLGVEGPLV